MMSIPITNDLSKRIKFYREQQFTGILSVDVKGKEPWYIYFLAGQIVWVNTQPHSMQRWHRQLSTYWPKRFNPDDQSSPTITYSALAKLVMHKKFDRRRFSDIVAGYISENLFDIIQQGTLAFQSFNTPLTYKVSARDAASLPYINLPHVHLWERVLQHWQTWEDLGLVNIQPNQVPIIVNPRELQKHLSPGLFQCLSELAHNRETLQDLATKLRQPLTLTSLAVSILPHVQNHVIHMVEVKDVVTDPVATLPSLSPDTIAAYPRENSQTAMGSKCSGNGATVLYIDDSPTDSQAMAKIVQAVGYDYINIADPIQALPRLLEIKPQIIFLDLVMPIANGYELCAQIRRISAFKQTPIVIVTNNDGIADRVRAKVVGASGFMSKPISHQRVVKLLRKYPLSGNSTTTTLHQPPLVNAG